MAEKDDTATQYQRLRAKRRRILIALGVAAMILPLLSIMVGAADVSISDIVGVIASHIPGLDVEITWPRTVDAIVWQTRLPRVIVGVCVGAILGVSGAVLQAIVRNPLAEPYVLGVSSGASTGAAFMMILIGATASWAVGASAFLGALLAVFVLLIVTGHTHSSLHLILAGLAVSFGFQALTNFVIFSSGSPETNQAVMFWMLGSLARSNWDHVALLVIVAIAFTALTSLIGPILDALASGDHTAQVVGIEPSRARLAILIPVSAVIGVAVAATGAIGFVGLIIPHIARSLVGHAHRLLMIGCAFLGGLFLVATDTVARVIFAPTEMPIGVITGLIGAPFIVVLVKRMQKGTSRQAAHRKERNEGRCENRFDGGRDWAAGRWRAE